VVVERGVIWLDAQGFRHLTVLIETAHLRLRGGFVTITGPQERTKSPADRMLAAAEKHAVVAEALTLLGSSATDRIYRAYEVIKHDVTFDGIRNMMQCSQIEVQRFSWTVNRPRHVRVSGPPSGGPMNSDELDAFVQRMIIA
jgi:hypothetical protein